MKRMLLASAALLLLSSSVVRGENRDERQMSGRFDAIEVRKGANIALFQSDKNKVEIVTEGCPTADVLTSVEEGVLLVRMSKRTAGSAVMVNVYFTGDIHRILVRQGASASTGCLYQSNDKLFVEVGGKSEVNLEVAVGEMEVDANTCHVSLEGTAKHLKANFNGRLGKAVYNCRELKCEAIDIRAVNADSEVCFTDWLKAEASGCTIRYKGAGQVRKTLSGGGLVEPF